jgi:hypothetical protein
MNRPTSSCPLAVLFVVTIQFLSLGCNLDGEDGPIKIDPEAAAQLAIKEYDGDGDGILDANEIRACPALAEASRRVDSNGDGVISGEEISQRVQAYASFSEFIVAEVYVNQNRRPVAGAEVVFEPEPFMGDGFPTYRGTTDENGMAVVDSEPMTPGLALGFYRIRITKGDELPAKYNTETILGREIADDMPSPNRIVFNLK